ncbi:MAG: hypothetical protein J5711_01305 [Bacteroidales bacterium]|nr:hypothetical protein [Bacteroidales bacterium]
MKQSCPDCKTIIEIDEKEFTPGEKIVRECPLCGNSVEFIIPDEKNEVKVVETTVIKEVESAESKKKMKDLQKKVQQLSDENNQIKGQQKKEQVSTKAIIIIIAAVLLLGGIVGGIFYYNNVYLPEKRDAEAPRYYVIAANLNMRSTPEFDADYNKIASFPYGTEILIYDSTKYVSKPYMHGKYAPVDASGKVLKKDCVEGYIAYDYMLPKADFFLLNSIFGNDDARKMLAETRYKRALLAYFIEHNIRGDISASKMDEYGITAVSKDAQRWQVFCRYEKAKSNNVYRSKKYRKDSKYSDAAIIIQNIDSGERKMLYFTFDDDETPHLLFEQWAPSSGYMKDRTLKLNQSYGGYYVDVEYEY